MLVLPAELVVAVLGGSGTASLFTITGTLRWPLTPMAADRATSRRRRNAMAERRRAINRDRGNGKKEIYYLYKLACFLIEFFQENCIVFLVELGLCIDKDIGECVVRLTPGINDFFCGGFSEHVFHCL